MSAPAPKTITATAPTKSVAPNQQSHTDNHTRLPDDFYSTNLNLQMSRARVLEHLGRTTNPSHRAMLERALDAIEQLLKRHGGD